MKNVENFDWDWTRRKIMIVIPYHGNRIRQLKFSLSKIKTILPLSDWGVVICDDGADHDISELEHKNIKIVRIRKPGAPLRNGCLCRNVGIRRCLSDWVISVDPEIVWTGDFIHKISNLKNRIVRIRNVRYANYQDSEKILNNEILPEEISFTKCSTISAKVTKKDSFEVDNDKKGLPHIMHKWGIHYGFALPKKIWDILRGYDERLVEYGPDDYDIMRRSLILADTDNLEYVSNKIKKLKRLNLIKKDINKSVKLHPHMIDDVIATHIYHERSEQICYSYKKEIHETGFARNIDIDWGMQYDRIQ